MQITIYTDGACDIHAENQPGGWAAILRATDSNGKLLKEIVRSGGQEHTTNNRMELTAVIEGLKALNGAAKLTVFTDSRYVIGIASGENNAKKNQELWLEYFRIAPQHEIDWRYVQGHSGNALNERCDRLAVEEKIRLVKTEAIDTSSASIQVYLSTQHGGRVKATAWAAVIVRGKSICDESGYLSNTTELEATLIGAKIALGKLPPGISAALFTEQTYLADGMNRWRKGWKAKQWKKKNGEPVKHKEHWRELDELSSRREVEFRFVKERDSSPYFLRAKAAAAEVMRQA